MQRFSWISAEGIVFHHPDGRRAKIKRKDFAWGSEPVKSGVRSKVQEQDDDG
jgi:hypothetical protein